MIGSCQGYHPRGCGAQGYASSDIFYLEVCVYSLACRNRDQLWRLESGDRFECEMDWAGFQQLRDWLLMK